MENVKTLFRGETSEKIINGEKRIVTPITYIESTPFGDEMGVGLNFKNEDKSYKSLWGLIAPVGILASYRGMKIAELVPEFKDWTLCDCWYAGNRDEYLGIGDKEKVLRIEELIGKEARKRILEQIPEDLDAVIRDMERNNMPFDVSELLAEAIRGTIQNYAAKAYADAYKAYETLRNESLFESVKRHLTGRKE